MKTKMMIVSTSKARRERFGQIVEEFVNLASLITNNILDEEISGRLVLANRTYYGLQKVFNSKMLSRKTKIQFYKTLVRSLIICNGDLAIERKNFEENIRTCGR